MKSAQLFPALPGFKCLTQMTDEMGNIIEVHRASIIAWIIEQPYIDKSGDWSVNAPFAVTIEGGVTCDCAIEDPDGRICVQLDRYFDNDAELLKYWQEIEVKRAEIDAKRKAALTRAVN